MDWSEMQTCTWPSWCHCQSLSLASVKSRLVLPFWYRFSRVVLEKGPLNRCVCVRACVFQMVHKVIVVVSKFHYENPILVKYGLKSTGRITKTRWWYINCCQWSVALLKTCLSSGKTVRQQFSMVNDCCISQGSTVSFFVVVDVFKIVSNTLHILCTISISCHWVTTQWNCALDRTLQSVINYSIQISGL